MLSPSASSRRRLLKRFALGALAFPVGGELAHDLFLTELEAAVLPTTATIRLSLQEFPSLQSEMGSLRLGVNPVGFDHFPQGTFYPILINRGLGTTFHALSAECRHASCVVDSYDDFVQGLECPCHHSLYGIDGAVLRGPANKGLKKFVSHFDGKETLTVQVPGMAFSVTPRLQSAATTSRLRLEFQAESDVVYELQFKQRLHDAWSSVPFAIAADGVVDQSNWSGPEGPMSFYVERSSARGYYSIFMDWVEV